MSAHTDIVRDGFIARLPRRWQPFLLLARLDRPIGVWLLFLPGLWSLLLARPSPRRGLWLIALFAAGSVLMRAAGCIINDMWDRDLDRKVARTTARPLASGALGMRAAAGFLAVLLTLSLAILEQLPPLAEGLAVGSLALVATYPLAKRVTWWPQIMLGFTFGWGAPLGYAAAAGRLDPAAGALYLAAILWILGYDTVYAHQDREDDALIGVKSTARLFGRHTRVFVAVCYALALFALIAAGRLAGLGVGFFVALILPAGLLAWQVAKLDIDDPALCLRLFKANREAGLAIALALALGAWFA